MEGGLRSYDSSACGRAAQVYAQTVISDVRRDPLFAPHRKIAAATGFRAVESTPIIDRGGQLLGVLSTHCRRPRRASRRELLLAEWYANRIGTALQAAAGSSLERVFCVSSREPRSPSSALNGFEKRLPPLRAFIQRTIPPSRRSQTSISSTRSTRKRTAEPENAAMARLRAKLILERGGIPKR